jgi:hypothetical protein
LSSRIHVLWALAKGGTLEDRPVYNTTQCFETFPFPPGLTPRDSHNFQKKADGAAPELSPAIAAAAKRLNELQTGQGGRAQEAHPDQPLQPAPGLAGPRAQGAGCRRRRRLRLGRLHARDAGRGNFAPASCSKLGTLCHGKGETRLNYVLSDHARKRCLRRKILSEWIAATLENPARTENDANDPTLAHALRAIPEKGFRMLRVIYNETTDPVTIVTVFFDDEASEP